MGQGTGEGDRLKAVSRLSNPIHPSIHPRATAAGYSDPATVSPCCDCSASCSLPSPSLEFKPPGPGSVSRWAERLLPGVNLGLRLDTLPRHCPVEPYGQVSTGLPVNSDTQHVVAVA